MNYRYKATDQFWRAFYGLPPAKKASVREAWQVFKKNPFDPRLGTHKIFRLSARYRKTIYSVVIGADLRVVFYLEGDLVVTVDIGTHDIYRA
jgi:hypothetical protein